MCISATTVTRRKPHPRTFSRSLGLSGMPLAFRIPVGAHHRATFGLPAGGGRAFAAEFLAPSDEIEAMKAEKRDVVTIANEFAVSQQVIEYQIANRDRIVAAMTD